MRAMGVLMPLIVASSFLACADVTRADQALAASSPSTRPSEISLELEVVLEQLEKARAGVPPMAYTLKWHKERKESKGVTTYDALVSVVRDGTNYRVEQSQVVTLNGEPTLKLQGRVLVTSRCCIIMDFDDSIISEWERKPGGPVPEDAAQHARLHTGPDMLLWGFGIGTRTLRELLDAKTVQNRLVVRSVQQDGKPMLEIDLLRADPGKKDRLISTFVSDPSRNFLITSGRGFDASGATVREFQVGLKEIQPGVWFPIRVDAWDKNDGVSKYRIEVTQITTLEDCAGQFELAAMKPNEGARIRHFHKDGRSEAYIVRSGKSIPLDVDDELRK